MLVPQYCMKPGTSLELVNIAFVRVIQLEDVWVLRVIRQLHHPAHNRDLFARCGFIVFSVCAPQGLGSVVQEGGSREYDPVPGP